MWDLGQVIRSLFDPPVCGDEGWHRKVFKACYNSTRRPLDRGGSKAMLAYVGKLDLGMSISPGYKVKS